MGAISGIHHVAAIAASGRATLDFYTGALGMQLIARTVDFDQTSVAQLYCGNPGAPPGSVLSFFIHPGHRRGREGIGFVGALSLAVPRGSLPAWQLRLAGCGVTILGPTWSFHEEHLCFNDPDGLELSLVEAPPTAGGAASGHAPSSNATPGMIGIKGIEVQVDGVPPATRLLLDTLGFRRSGQDGAATRFRIGRDGDRAALDLILTPPHGRGVAGAGILRHVALRVPDIATIERAAAALAAQGVNVTAVMDRMFFRAAYFRMLGGVAFALATDGPGFAPAPAMPGAGDRLLLPEWLEPRRAEIEHRLGGAPGPQQ